MNLEQAQKIRSELIYLEGIIARETAEYIWKVLIGPQDRQKLESFRSSFDPAMPFDPYGIIRPYIKDELSVYFLLKKRGNIICRRYEEFLSANHIEIGNEEILPAGLFKYDFFTIDETGGTPLLHSNEKCLLSGPAVVRGRKAGILIFYDQRVPKG